MAVNCPSECSLHPDKIGPGVTAALLAIRENGAGRPTMLRRAVELLGHPISGSSMDRHLKHYRDLEPEGQFPAPTGKQAGDLEILNQIIQRGFQHSGSWKPTIKDTIEAMKLKMQMTGNSAFDDMLAAMERGLALHDGIDDPEDVLPENPEALADEDERSDEDEPLGDPAL